MTSGANLLLPLPTTTDAQHLRQATRWATQSSKGPPLHTNVNRLWACLSTVPLDMLAACEGRSRSIRSVVAAATGLSEAHLSQSGLAVKSPKRAQSIQARIRTQARRLLTAKGYSPDEIAQILAEHPDTPFAGLVYRLGQAGPAPLELAIRFSARVDQLVEGAGNAVATGAVETYKALLLQFLGEELPCYRAPDAQAALTELQKTVSAAANWDDLDAPTNTLVEYLLLAVLAAVDVEWGARYFGGLTPTPTLLWMSPRFHPDFDPQNSKGLKRDVVARPVGNLLRVMWTFAKRGTSKRAAWPAQPPGPTQLTRDIAREDISDGLVRKWSTGAKPANLDQMVDVWNSLCHSLSGGPAYAIPFPWIATALWMERALVKRKPESSIPRQVILLSDTAYRSIWTGHRNRWSAQLPKPGDRPWPEWLLTYSSWPDWMRSSQSSGRESSPRDCQ
jgi:hypothetical protein